MVCSAYTARPLAQGGVHYAGARNSCWRAATDDLCAFYAAAGTRLRVMALGLPLVPHKMQRGALASTGPAALALQLGKPRCRRSHPSGVCWRTMWTREQLARRRAAGAGSLGSPHTSCKCSCPAAPLALLRAAELLRTASHAATAVWDAPVQGQQPWRPMRAGRAAARLPALDLPPVSP